MSHIPSHWTPVQRAAYKMVHEFRHGDKEGAEALGPLVGKAPGTICNEVNPNVTTHKLGLEDTITYEHATRDYRPLQAHAQTLHHICISLPEISNASDIEVLNKFSNWQSKMGATCQVIHQAFDDHRISEEEVRTIREYGQVHMRAFLELVHRLEALIDG